MAKTTPYDVIADRILAMLDKGTVPWHMPWGRADLEPMSLSSGKPYRGINVFMLHMVRQQAGYESRYWLTFNQAKKLGGNVKKDEAKNHTPVCFWKWLDIEEEQDDGSKKMKKIPLLRYFRVYNYDQCEGIEVKKVEEERPEEFDNDPIADADAIVEGMPNRPSLEHAGSQAYYSPSQDKVVMPRFELFGKPEEYYSTIFHELCHSTGHESRLDRKSIGKKGDDKYGQEELVAEMGAAFLCGEAGIVNDTIDNSASYIAGWKKKIKHEQRPLESSNPELAV